tara:strand:+ start:2045 stop:3349 length:1305 start_codon:yes stop_codon:yes gene_type:complete
MKFELKSVAELEKLSAEDLQNYFEEKAKAEKEAKEGAGLTALETKAKVLSLETKLKKAEDSNLELKTNITNLAGVVEGLQKSGGASVSKHPIQEALEAKSEEVDILLNNEKAVVKFELKTQNRSSIESTEKLTPVNENVIDKPKRSLTRIQDLFPVVKISKDNYRYTEQSDVVRDGRSVAYNTSFTSNTSETVKVSSIEVKIVKAFLDISTDLIKDFPYMEGRSDKLTGESVAYKVEKAFIQGDGLNDNISGLVTYAAEFDSEDTANDGTDLHAPVDSIPDANLIDLVLSMDMQIDVHGEENDYDANTLLMHRSDWFKGGGMLKDSTGRYLDERIQRNGREVLIDGKLSLVTSNNCPKGTLFVMDTTKGEKIDRDVMNVSIAYENGTKWEQEIATMKGYTRLNLLVPNENKGAFLKCTAIEDAIDAIGTVPAEA